MFKKHVKNAAIGFLLGMIHFVSNAEHHPLIAEKAITQTKESEPYNQADESMKKNNTIFEFPALAGKYGVGTTTRHIVDTHRKEAQNPTSQRELMIHMWYPSLAAKNCRVPYLADEIENVKTSLKQIGYPEGNVDEIDIIFSHAIPEASFLNENKPYPIILFSHGYLGCLPTDYTAFCEELTSHGYIVVSVAHTYYAQMVKFPDGHIITPSREIFAQPIPTENIQTLWAEDVQAALDYLMNINNNPNDPFYNCFDSNRVGTIGHSMGGSTAFRLCLNDNRFKAGVSLDSSPWAQDEPYTTLKKPFLSIFSENTIRDLEKTDQEVAALHNVPIETVIRSRSIFQKQVHADIIIPKILHGGFNDYLLIKDVPLYKNNKHLINLEAITGPANGHETIQYINKEVVQFLKNSL